ncbi:MAG: hypothetical protein ACJ706_06845, partial [Nitrososphaeraceae archaeon]
DSNNPSPVHIFLTALQVWSILQKHMFSSSSSCVLLEFHFLINNERPMRAGEGRRQQQLSTI